MKKIISILTVTLFAICITKAQDTIRSLKVGEWEKTLETNITYTVEPNGNSIEIKEGEINLHSFTVPDSLIFNSIDLTNDEGVIINGKKWATRNLAEHGKFVEKPEDYGAFFQWGRVGDGHEQRTSLNYPTNDNSIENGAVSGDENFDANGQIVNIHTAYSKFIKQNENPGDWRVPQNDLLWNLGSETVPVKTANDPCPNGWRVPTAEEFQSLALSGGYEWVILNGIAGCYVGNESQKLFLPAAGVRQYNNGLLDVIGTHGLYWSSTPFWGFQANCLFFLSDGGGLNPTNYGGRANGLSIRCIADQ